MARAGALLGAGAPARGNSIKQTMTGDHTISEMSRCDIASGGDFFPDRCSKIVPTSTCIVLYCVAQGRGTLERASDTSAGKNGKGMATKGVAHAGST